MLSEVISAGFFGVEGYLLKVEVDISNGLPSFNIVGLGDTAVVESKERVKAGIKNSSYELMQKKIVVNLSPADIRKEGSGFDIAIAVGILACSGVVIKDRLRDYIIIGELSLGGEVKPVKGIINAVITAKENGLKGIVLPFENYREASMIEGVEIIPVRKLKEVVEFLNEGKFEKYSFEEVEEQTLFYNVDFSEVKGQHQAKRAMEISAAGGHNLFMVGSPGSGKSMLAKRLFTIMPEMSDEEIIECTKIYSIAGLLNEDTPIIKERPFRSPHHTSSNVSLIGGGRTPKPGEITLAHNGILFLDEMSEFPKKIIETLRQPLEDKEVNINRAQYRIKFPTEFILVGASNPCPCGYYGHETIGNKCKCSERDVQRYMSKISGPILDRMDLYVEVKRLNEEELLEYEEGEKSEAIKSRVVEARKIQNMRLGGSRVNSGMTQDEIKRYCILGKNEKEILKKAGRTMGLSGRAFDKIIKVARTIADLNGDKEINKIHLLEALNFRRR
jgi:magnesium chelatase family protein